MRESKTRGRAKKRRGVHIIMTRNMLTDEACVYVHRSQTPMILIKDIKYQLTAVDQSKLRIYILFGELNIDERKFLERCRTIQTNTVFNVSLKLLPVEDDSNLFKLVCARHGDNFQGDSLILRTTRKSKQYMSLIALMGVTKMSLEACEAVAFKNKLGVLQ